MANASIKANQFQLVDVTGGEALLHFEKLLELLRMIRPHEDICTIMNLWREKQIEGDIAEATKNIAHEFYYTDKDYVISTNSLGKMSVNTPVSESDKQARKVKSKIYERTCGKEEH